MDPFMNYLQCCALTVCIKIEQVCIGCKQISIILHKSFHKQTCKSKKVQFSGKLPRMKFLDKLGTLEKQFFLFLLVFGTSLAFYNILYYAGGQRGEGGGGELEVKVQNVNAAEALLSLLGGGVPVNASRLFKLVLARGRFVANFVWSIKLCALVYSFVPTRPWGIQSFTCIQRSEISRPFHSGGDIE